MGPYILGVVMALVALLGLVMASVATDGFFYGVGLFFTIIGVILVFYLIHRETGVKNSVH